jgi:hypothetical protein
MSNHKGRVKFDSARHDEIVALFRAGMKCADIGQQFGLTRAGISHALRRAGVARSEEDKSAIAACERGFLLFCIETCEAMRDVHEKFVAQRDRARDRNVQWDMTFGEWWSVWHQSGQWAERGRSGAESAVMARRGDAGPYSVSNVYITTLRANFIESHQVRGHWVRSESSENPVSFFDAPTGYSTGFNNHVPA